MAFPVVAARASGRTTASDTTTHAITLPTGISAGDLLVVVFACDGNPTISVNTGVSGANWNALTQGAYSNNVRSNVFWKIAEGSDALTLTTPAGEQSSHVSLRITGGYTVTGTSANGSSTNSNPPNHAGPDGTQDYLWVATRAGDSTVVATVAPTNYGNLQTLAAAGTGGASVNTAERSLNASAEDPGTFTSSSEQWVGFTLAVSPVAPGGILASPAVAVGGAQVVAELTALSYLISVAVAIGGGSAAAPAAVLRGSQGASVGLAAARASAALILGGSGVSAGTAALSAAAALIRSAPAVAAALAGVAAPPAMVRAGAAVALSGGVGSAPAAMIRGGHGEAAGIAILAGLGILVQPELYATGRLAFAAAEPRRGEILNKAMREGEILNPVRRGRIVELEE